MSILDDEYTNLGAEGEGELQLSSRLKGTWLSTGKWAMFLSVLGFLGVGAVALITLAVGSMIQTFMGMLSAQYPALRVIQPFAGYFTLIMVPVLILFFIIFLYHIRFAAGIQKALRNNDQEMFTAAWRNLRNYFRISGIFMVLLMVFYLVVMILALSTDALVEPVPVEGFE